jgi:membrane protease YdiL (CAAX protease family)
MSLLTPAAAGPSLPAWNYWDMAKALVAVIVGTVVAATLAVPIADSLLEPGQKYEDNATAYAIVLVPSMVVVEILLLAAAVWFGPRKYGLPLASLGLRKTAHAPGWLAGVLALAGLVLIYGYVAALSLIGVEPDASTPEQVFDDAGPFLVVALAAIVMAPAIEEIFFRGFIFGGLQGRMGWVLAGAISSLLFALAHLSFYVVPPFACLGFLFAWSYRYTGSITSAMIAHFIINLVSLGAGLATSG